jgi:hypothetical protein
VESLNSATVTVTFDTNKGTYSKAFELEAGEAVSDLMQRATEWATLDWS